MRNDSSSATQAVHLLSLGCPKNRVDSEVMLGHLTAAGYRYVSAPEEAEVIVVNTCGFIDAAREESVDAIVAMAEHKRGRCTTLVVAGCLSQRHGDELARALPEVDHFLGTGNFETIAGVLAGAAAPTAAARGGRLPIVDAAGEAAQPRPHPRLTGRNRLVPFRHGGPGQAGPWIPDPDFTLTSASPRLTTGGGHSRYLKVSEGCSNTCGFCIIPKLRGPQRSRPIVDVVAEARRHIDDGAKELNLLAQDLSAVGRDRRPRESLAGLLAALDGAVVASGREVWLRCLYAYPRGLTDEVLAVMAEARHIVPYLDMPLQHISDRILRSMRRGAFETATRGLVARLRARVPNLVLRTTFIAGLPGESEREFEELCAFVAEAAFEHVGVFAYSPQAGTEAAALPGQVPAEVANSRRDTLMALQQEISRGKQQALRGSRLEVLVDGPSADSELVWEARHAGQAPDVDGVTYITSGRVRAGDRVAVRVEETGDYDVAGPLCA